MLQTIRKAITSITRALMGYEFRTVHIAPDGKRKVFHCETMQDAIEWVSCALNEDQIKIIDRNGYLVASRARIKA